MKSACLLAFDFGLARIGVAQGDKNLAIAHPLITIQIHKNTDQFSIIENLIHEWQPVELIVGLPMHIDGTEHEFSIRCRRFARQLHGRFHLPVFLVDERLSSLVAESMLKEAHVFGKKQKPVLDQVAAIAILQTYFEDGATEIIKRNQ